MFTFFKKPLGLTALVLVIITAGSLALQNANKSPQGELTQRVPQVALINVAQEAGNGSSLNLVGEVESLGQVELRSQVFKEVSRVNVEIGDQVGQGDVLVVLDNSDLSASLRQAEASVAAERARLKDMEDNSQVEQSLDNAYQNVINVTQDALAEAEDAALNKTEGLFTGNKYTNFYTLFDVCSKSLRNDVQDLREEVEFSLDDWARDLDDLPIDPSNSDLDILLNTAQENLSDTSTLMSLLSRALSDGCAFDDSRWDSFRTSIPIARDRVVAARASVEQLIQSIDSLEVSFDNQNAVDSQKARVDSAEAIADGIRANIAKTVIRSSIDGVVSSVPVRVGELVTSGELIAKVVNNSGFQIKTFVSSDDAKLVEEGASVLIDGDIKGEVARVSPGIDPTTSKIEVLVVVQEENPDLVVGEFVNVDISIQGEKGQSSLLMPLESIKTTSGGSYVYVINDGVLEAKKVDLGKVVGDRIEVTEGLSGVASIVESVRGLNLGQQVEVRD